jgi:uncharacterized delta-60 repeat protein
MRSSTLVAMVFVAGGFSSVANAAPGDLDTTFNPSGSPAGTLTTALGTGGTDSAHAVIIQPADGKIVAAGYSYNPTFAMDPGNTWFTVARYNSNGGLDHTFNPTGSWPGGATGAPGTVATYITPTLGENRLAINSLAIQADGKIVAGGNNSNSYTGISVFALARYNTNGSLDTTFNPSGTLPGTSGTLPGMASTAFSHGGAVINSIAIQPADGKIVAAGVATSINTYGQVQQGMALARYSTNGSLDTTFNPTGSQPGTLMLTMMAGTNPTTSSARSVAIQADGKIIAAGSSQDSNEDPLFTLARYNTNGSLDTTFNPAGTPPGTVTTALGPHYTDAELMSVAIQPADGKIVAAGGKCDYWGSCIFALARYNTNGSLDTTFNPAGSLPGTVTTAFGASSYKIMSMAIQADGKIVATGFDTYGLGNSSALVRYNTNGSLDSTFNPTGSQPGTVITSVTGDQAYSVAIQPADGKIVTAGNYNRGFTLARYLAAPFSDTSGNWAASYINAIYGAGITTGCGGGNYCPSQNVTRDQMAAFIIRAKEGEPAATCATPPFTDVPISDGFCKYVKRMLDLSITTGCGSGNYCPTQNVTRDQMAAFIIRAVEGEPSATCTTAPFTDVPISDGFCKYVKRMVALNITTGCGGGNYCPSQTVTRDQMAVFLARAFLGM